MFAQNHERKQFREINKTDDIEGANSGSLKKAPTTKRQLNPLSPEYKFPGHTDLVDKLNPFSKSKKELLE